MVRVPTIAGIAGPAIEGSTSLAEQVLERWIDPRSAPEVTRTRSAIFVSRDDVSPPARVGRQSGARDGEAAFVADIRLDNRPQLAELLSIPSGELDGLADRILLQRLFTRSGAQGVAQVLGAFVFAHWDEGARRLTLTRDCLGQRALFFHRGDGFVAFASDLNVLLSLSCVPREIDEDAVANFLVLNHRRPHRTFYRDIERVPSRTMVTIDGTGVRREHYWSPDLSAPPPFNKEEDYIERARELLDEAVARSTADTSRLAILTSGGLDSSAIAATAARLGRAQTITCYTVVPPPDLSPPQRPGRYFSERSKVEALARMHPALNVEFCEERGSHRFEDDPTSLFVRSASPVVSPCGLGTFGPVFDRIASARHPVLHVGNRGNSGLSWRGRFSFLELLSEGKLLTLAYELTATARQTERSLLKTLGSEIVPTATPRWLLRQIYRLYGWNPDDVSRYSSLNPDIARAFAQSGAWRDDGFDPCAKFIGDPVRFRAYWMFDRNQTGRDIWAGSRAIFGFETRDPHADRPLLEFLLRVPQRLYRQNGIERAFARKVLADRLPREILDEMCTGAQGVTWFQRLDGRRADLADEIERLAASPLASRLLDVPRLKRILDDWPKDAEAAESRAFEIRAAFGRGIHVGRFVRWVEGGNA